MDSETSPPLHPVSQEVISAGSTVVGILRQCQIAYQSNRVLYGFLFGTSRTRTITSQEDLGIVQCSSRVFGIYPRKIKIVNACIWLYLSLNFVCSSIDRLFVHIYRVFRSSPRYQQEQASREQNCKKSILSLAPSCSFGVKFIHTRHWLGGLFSEAAHMHGRPCENEAFTSAWKLYIRGLY